MPTNQKQAPLHSCANCRNAKPAAGAHSYYCKLLERGVDVANSCASIALVAGAIHNHAVAAQRHSSSNRAYAQDYFVETTKLVHRQENCQRSGGKPVAVTIKKRGKYAQV